MNTTNTEQPRRFSALGQLWHNESALVATMIAITLLVLVFLGFDLLLQGLMNRKPGGSNLTVHSLFLTRGLVITGLIGMWAWYVMRWRFKKLDRAVRHWELFYTEQIRVLSEPVLFLDLEGRLTYWNEAAESLFGLEETHRGMLDPSLESDEGDRLKETLQVVLRKGETALRAGSKIDLICMTAEGRKASMTHHVSLMRDVEESALGFIILKVNIEPVLEQAAKLATLEKFAAIGNMTAAIAHQLNTPLNSILLSIEMLDDEGNGINEEDRELIKGQVQDCKEHVQRLLRLARDPAMSSGHPEPFCLHELVTFLAGMYERVLRSHGTRLRYEQKNEHACGGCNLIGDRYAVRQALMNLISNAAEALEGRGGTIEILCGFEDGRAVIDVCDDGPGIPAAQQEKIWEPFFSTKEKGTGLGLAVTRRIITDLGGRVTVESDNTGTRFRISIPNPTDPIFEAGRMIRADDLGVVAK